jgi:ribosomal 30S subunit maturation factor RimM
LKKAKLQKIGKVARSHGKEGELKVKLQTELLSGDFFLRFF